MLKWILIQIGLIIILYVISAIFLRTQAWKIGFPFSLKKVTKVVLFKLVPFIWGLLSFAIGISYALLNAEDKQQQVQLLLLTIVPLIVISLAGYSFFIQAYKDKKNEVDEDQLLKDKTKEFKAWAEQFGFLEDQIVGMKIYISKGKPVGRVQIKNLTESQITELANNKDELPEGIYLEIDNTDTKSNNHNLH